MADDEERVRDNDEESNEPYEESTIPPSSFTATRGLEISPLPPSPQAISPLSPSPQPISSLFPPPPPPQPISPQSPTQQLIPPPVQQTSNTVRPDENLILRMIKFQANPPSVEAPPEGMELRIRNDIHHLTLKEKVSQSSSKLKDSTAKVPNRGQIPRSVQRPQGQSEKIHSPGPSWQPQGGMPGAGQQSQDVAAPAVQRPLEEASGETEATGSGSGEMETTRSGPEAGQNVSGEQHAEDSTEQRPRRRSARTKSQKRKQ